MKALGLLAAAVLALSVTPALAFRDAPTQQGDAYGAYGSSGQDDIFTGTVSSSKNRTYAPQPYEPRETYQQPEPQRPSVAIIRLSGSGNGSARQAVIENSPDLRERIARGEVQTRDVLIGRVDLNGDGKDEIFAYNESPAYCNGDLCPLSVYQVVRGRPLRPVLQGYMTYNRVGVLGQYEGRGWRDIVVYDPRGRQVALGYDGTQYQPPRHSHRGWSRFNR